MMDNAVNIPQGMRNITEQTMKRGHDAYEQLTDIMTKVTDAWICAMPANAFTAGFKGLRDSAVGIAKKNTDSTFALMRKVLALQTKFAQDQVQAYSAQTREIQGLFREAFKSYSMAYSSGSSTPADSSALSTKPADISTFQVSAAA